jgi:hypothetical protein
MTIDISLADDDIEELNYERKTDEMRGEGLVCATAS